MPRRKRFSPLFVLILLGLLAPAAGQRVLAEEKPSSEKTPSAKKKNATKFVRIHRDKKGELLSMDTAIVRYEGKNDKGEVIIVDLVGAIHIADRTYYEKLNKEFEKYDVLLYELVAPKGARPARGAAGLWSPIGRMLELADQVYEVDYEKENFVHADMSFDQLRESMKKRNESFTKLFFTLIGHGIAQQSSGKGPSDAEFLAAMLFAKNKSLAWKRLMAPQFDDMETAMRVLSGPEGSTLITERNKVAIKVLGEQLDQGKKELGIFYGAGHLPDLEERLVKEFGLKRTEHRWLVAWDLTGKAKNSGAKKDAKEQKSTKDEASDETRDK